MNGSGAVLTPAVRLSLSYTRASTFDAEEAQGHTATAQNGVRSGKTEVVNAAHA